MRKLLALLLLAPCALLAQVPGYVPTDGLAGWWSLDGAALDAGTNALHGTLEGPTAGEDRYGNPNGALNFDGVDDRVNIPHSDFTNPSVLSLSVWFKDSDFSNPDGQQSQLISKREFAGWGNAYEFGIGYPINGIPDTPTIYSNFSVNGNHTVYHATDSIVQNQWHHAVYCHGADSLFIYLDGEQVLAQTSPGPLPTNNVLPTWFGGRPGGSGRNFYSGLLDEVGMWNRVLTAEEVATLYQSSNSEEPCFDFSEIPAEIHLDNGPVTLQLGPGESSLQADANGAVTISEPGLFVLERSVGDAYLSLVQDSSWVDFGDILNDLTPPVSFSFNVRLTGNGGPILATDNGNPSYYNGYWISLSTSQLACNYGDGGWHGGGERRTGRVYSDFAQNEWYHITCVVTGANDFTFYLDGVEQTTSYNDAGFGGAVNFTSDPMKLGHHNAASPGTGAVYDQCFTGDLNNVTVWHRALNGAEASAMLEGGLPDDLTSLVAHWDFNDTSGGVVVDGSGLGHDGQLMGNATISITPQCTTTDSIVVHSPMDPEEEENQALDFPGIDVPFSESGVMEVPYDAALDRTGADPFTIAADVLLQDEDWFNLFHTGQDGDPENNITFRLSASEINLFWENAGVNYQLNGTLASQQLGPLAIGQWHHIAASWDGSTLALYVNGLEIVMDSPSNGGPGETADRSFYWGSKHGENSLHGQLDNAQFWTVGLSQSAIIDYMNCPPVGNEPGLEGYWTFDGTDAEVALDITGNGHDGSTLGLARVTSTRPACLTGNADLFGCTDSTACNYDDSALFADGTCVYGCQFCGENTIWDSLLLQCVSPGPSIDTVLILQEVPIPSCGTGTVWDPVAQECIVAIPTDTDFDGCVSAGDVLNLLATFGTCPPIPEWPDTPPDTTGTSWMCGDPLPYQGYDYTTVQIGDQCWFAENLRNTAYSNGDVIETVSNIEDWVASTEGLVETYGTNVWGCQDLEFAPFDVCNPDSSLQYFGRHYNWYAVNDARGLCPSGWHVPSDSAFAELEAFLGLPEDELYALSWRGTDEGGQMKSSSTDVYPWNGSNSSGFSAVPSGSINSGFDTPFGGAGYDVVIWTSTNYATSPPYAWYRALNSTYNRIHRNAFYRHLGGSVRCIKD